MTDYTINFTDPLRSTFIIRPYTSNGNRFPTSSTRNATSTQASSVLLLYGKGHPEYGERTDENLLHLAENFSGASAPVLDVSGNTTVGVIWHREYLYWRDTSGAPDWYEYRNGVWTSATVTENTLGSRPATAADGTLYYATDTATLYRYSDDERGLQQWVVREFEEDSVAPSGDPTRELVVNHDGTPSGWNVIASSTGGSFDSEYLRLDTTNGPLVGNLTIQKESPILTLNADGSPAGNPLIDLVGDSATIRLRGATNWSIADRPDGGANGTLEIRVGNTPGSNVYFEVDQDTGLLYARGDTAAAYAAAMTVGSPDDDQVIPNKRYVDDATASISSDSYVESTGSGFTAGVLTLATNASHPDSPSFTITGFSAVNILYGGSISGIGPLAAISDALSTIDTTKLTLTAGFGTQEVRNAVDFFEPTTVPDITAASVPEHVANKRYVNQSIYNREVVLGSELLSSPAIVSGSPPEGVYILSFNYVAGTHRLQIFLNGQKLYHNDNGHADVVFDASSPITPDTVLSPTGVARSYSVDQWDGSGWVLTDDFSTEFSVGDVIRVDGYNGDASPVASQEYTINSVDAVGSPSVTRLTVTAVGGEAVVAGVTVVGINYTFQMDLDGAGAVDVGTGTSTINGIDLSTGETLLDAINAALIDTFGTGSADAFFFDGDIRVRSLASAGTSSVSLFSGGYGSPPSATANLFDVNNLGADGFSFLDNSYGVGKGFFGYEEVEGTGSPPSSPYIPATTGTVTNVVRLTTTINSDDVLEFISTPV